MTYSSTENIILFGSGSAARDWIYANKLMRVDFIADNDTSKHGLTLHGIEIISPDKLANRSATHTVLIVSAYLKEIREQLESYGFTWGVNLFSALNQKELLLREDVSVEDFFETLNQSGASYVVIRNYENLPKMIGGDIDILINDCDIEKLLECGLIRSEFNRVSRAMPPIKIDAYSVYGSSGYRYRNMALFPPELANRVLKNRVLAKNNVYIPGPEDETWSYLYYICYFKNSASSLPPTDQQDFKNCSYHFPSKSELPKFDPLANLARHDYLKKVSDIFSTMNVDVNLSLQSIHEFLVSKHCAPPLSVVRRHVENLDVIGLTEEYLVKNITWYQDYKKISKFYPGLTIYFIRERGRLLFAMSEILRYLNESDFEVLFVHELVDRDTVSKVCRGGNWQDDGGISLNGLPVALVFLNDAKLLKLNSSQRGMNLPYVKYASYFIKDSLRNHLSEKYKDEYDLNIVHSTDDTFEVFETIGNLGLDDKSDVKKKLNEWLPKNLEIINL